MEQEKKYQLFYFLLKTFTKDNNAMLFLINNHENYNGNLSNQKAYNQMLANVLTEILGKIASIIIFINDLLKQNDSNLSDNQKKQIAKFLSRINYEIQEIKKSQSGVFKTILNNLEVLERNQIDNQLLDLLREDYLNNLIQSILVELPDSNTKTMLKNGTWKNQKRAYQNDQIIENYEDQQNQINYEYQQDQINNEIKKTFIFTSIKEILRSIINFIIQIYNSLMKKNSKITNIAITITTKNK